MPHIDVIPPCWCAFRMKDHAQSRKAQTARAIGCADTPSCRPLCAMRIHGRFLFFGGGIKSPQPRINTRFSRSENFLIFSSKRDWFFLWCSKFIRWSINRAKIVREMPIHQVKEDNMADSNNDTKKNVLNVRKKLQHRPKDVQNVKPIYVLGQSSILFSWY